MKPTSSIQTKVCYQFEIFCKKIISGERCDYLRELIRRGKRETVFSDLPDTVLANLYTFDIDLAEQTIFYICGYLIPIQNDYLAKALQTFGNEGYSILLLYYSLLFNDREIAKLLGISRSSVQKKRKKLLRKLKERMGEYTNANKQLSGKNVTAI